MRSDYVRPMASKNWAARCERRQSGEPSRVGRGLRRTPFPSLATWRGGSCCDVGDRRRELQVGGMTGGGVSMGRDHPTLYGQFGATRKNK